MTVASLMFCLFCSERVRAVEAVMVRDCPCHPACADRWWERLAETVEVP